MKEYKGKKIHLDKFEWEESKENDSNVKKFFNYEGYASDEDVPHGIGKMIEVDEEEVREGEWENGEFIKGTYSTPYIKRYIGSFRTSAIRTPKTQTFHDSMLHGDGEEYYYDSKEDYINDKPSGYVKGLFSAGALMEGEVLNPSITGYSEHEGIKKIICQKKNVREIFVKKIDHSIKLTLGEIYYDDGAHYKGELVFDLPFGKGTMTLSDGSKKTCNWYNGNIDED